MKRLIALVLALVFCVSFVYAEEAEQGTLPAFSRRFRLSEEEISVFARGEFTGETFSEQLDEEYLEIYNAIKDSALGVTRDTDFTAEVSIGVSGEWDANFYRDGTGSVMVDEATMAAVEEFCATKSEMLLPALSGLVQDEVELSWFVNQYFNLSSDLKYTVRWFGQVGRGTLVLNAIYLSFDEEGICAAEETGTLADFRSGIDAMMAEIDLSGAKNRRDAVEILHRYVCDSVEYAEDDIWQRKYQTVYSALEGVTVCAGYAKLFKALCDECDIPCILVTGESFGASHMWNYVLMEDGKWYAVDTTWDDQGSWMSDAYFLKGADTFGTEHTPILSWGMGYPYVYPTLAESEYAPNPAGLSTVNGAQIRTKGNMGLRFISSMEKIEDAVEYGMVLLPSEDLADISELQIGAAPGGRSVAKVPANYLYDEDEDSVTFTAVITNIAEKNYTRAYTARAYAILESGETVYGETYSSRSVAAVASAALERDPNLSEEDRTLFESIVNR